MPHIYEFIWQVGVYKCLTEEGLRAFADVLFHFLEENKGLAAISGDFSEK